MSKTVLVTGANRGIGLGLVKLLCEKGFRVLATCRSPASAPELKEILKKANQPEPIALDVGEDSSIDQLGKYLESNQVSVHHLINNAGVAAKNHPVDPPDDVDREDALKVIIIIIIIYHFHHCHYLSAVQHKCDRDGQGNPGLRHPQKRQQGREGDYHHHYHRYH